MQLDLDKRYFEHIPPERCECDCAFISHSDGCATEVGLYQVVYGDVHRLGEALTENLVIALRQHPLYVFLKTHRMVSEFESHFAYHSHTFVYSDRFDIYFTPYFRGLIVHDSFIDCRDLMSVFDVILSFRKDESTGWAYLKVKRAYFHSLYTNYDRRDREAFFEKLAYSDHRIKRHDIKPVGTKQAWLDSMKAFALYTTVWKRILEDVVNEIAPQFFKEQA